MKDNETKRKYLKGEGDTQKYYIQSTVTEVQRLRSKIC